MAQTVLGVRCGVAQRRFTFTSGHGATNAAHRGGGRHGGVPEFRRAWHCVCAVRSEEGVKEYFMKRQNHLQQSNLALFLGLLLCAAAMRGQQADEPAGGPTPKPTTEEVEKPMIETNDAAIELQIDKDEGVSLRGSGRRMPEIVKFGSDAIDREGRRGRRDR